MKDITSYTKNLAAKYGGDVLGKKEVPAPAPEKPKVSYQPAPKVGNAPRIWPSEMMELRSWKNNQRPARRAVNLFDFSDAELEEMFATPVRRGWEFSDWLEVIGLPPDLHKDHDGAAYSYAARAYLERKKEAHQR